MAKRLGLDIGGLASLNRDIEGIVDMMFDAVNNFDKPLTKERLFGWHYALFPMRVLSGAMGKEKVYYQAPPAKNIDAEMAVFLDWFNKKSTTDLVVKASVAHLWFVTLHPFEDGNGRIARAITDMLLARSDGLSQRFYSMSFQIQKERKAYYEILEKPKKEILI